MVSQTAPSVEARTPVPKKKKRRISKHVLKAQRDREVLDDDSRQALPTRRDAAEEPSAAAAIPRPQERATSRADVSRKKSHLAVKDPSEVLIYLTRWKGTQQPTRPEGKSTRGSTAGWKFNKNTQSWLIRHMYEVELVSKNTFILLLEYLQSLQGQSRVRVRDDALRRAHRYQRYHKAETEPIDQPMSRQHNDAESLLEQTRWDQLSDHDKRKEYKRARKIVEALQD